MSRQQWVVDGRLMNFTGGMLHFRGKVVCWRGKRKLEELRTDEKRAASAPIKIHIHTARLLIHLEDTPRAPDVRLVSIYNALAHNLLNAPFVRACQFDHRPLFGSVEVHQRIVLPGKQ